MNSEAPPPPTDAPAGGPPSPGASGANARGAPPEEVPPPAALVPALDAFATGDFRTSRRLVEALLAGAPTPEVAEAARALRAKLTPDPWVFWIGLAVIGLLAFVSSAYLF